MRRAVRALGEPTFRRGGRRDLQDRLGPLRPADPLQNFGGSDSCGPRGLAKKATISGDSRWPTEAGLRMGDSVARLRRLDPDAERTRRGFRLVEGILPFGRPVTYAVLGARVRGGELSAFTLFVGAAGD